MSIQPTQLIVFDELTNHLDLDSIEAIKNDLKLYHGDLLTISHDKVFLKDINIKRIINIKN
ncbi:hypothetical protein [Coxiella-like endosymbiont]|uniref:hypothetical protein n=1 Tax=Coxiella-like endosymbiont TaxID=1592897 RepID=UPI00272D6611|nr:hypothetical protein [Coxiella-like endosymbiont]